jgi:hypothetical protein
MNTSRASLEPPKRLAINKKWVSYDTNIFFSFFCSCHVCHIHYCIHFYDKENWNLREKNFTMPQKRENMLVSFN